jgi:uncharacterized protein
VERFFYFLNRTITVKFKAMNTVKPIVTWFEIPAKDLDRAINFYQKVLRLTIQKTDMMGIPYGLIVRPANTIGGVIVQRDVPSTEATVLFFYTHDITSTLERILALGGEVVMPKTILKLQQESGGTVIANSFIDNQTGYIAKFKDSEGNIMALHSNS